MSTIFMDGKYIPEEQAVISVKTHGFNYGTGCFEGIRAYYNKEQDALFVFRLEDHFKRFQLSCKTLMIELPYSVEELCQATIKLLKENFEKTDIYIRPLAYKSDQVVGNFNLKTLKNSVVIFTIPLGRYGDVENGIRASVSSWRRVPDNSIPPRAKITGSYVNTSLAKTDSLLAGYDEALLLDQNGHIVEGSAENIFMFKDGEIITPPVSDDILQGITRKTVMQLIKDKLKKDVIERSIDRSEIYHADEIILVGTGAEILPVVEVDGRKIGDGAIGKNAAKLKDLYYKLVHGELSEYSSFFTKVK